MPSLILNRCIFAYQFLAKGDSYAKNWVLVVPTANPALESVTSQGLFYLINSV